MTARQSSSSTPATTSFRRPVDERLDAGMDHGADAHQARFHGHVEGRLREAVVADRSPGMSQGDDLGVRGRVARSDRLVEARAHEAVLQDDDRADRYLAGRRGFRRLFERQTHEVIATRVHGGHG